LQGGVGLGPDGQGSKDRREKAKQVAHEQNLCRGTRGESSCEQRARFGARRWEQPSEKPQIMFKAPGTIQRPTATLTNCRSGFQPGRPERLPERLGPRPTTRACP